MNYELQIITTIIVLCIFIILFALFSYQMQLYFKFISLKYNRKIGFLNWFKDSNIYDDDFDWITNLFLMTPAFFFVIEKEAYDEKFHSLFLKRKSICQKFFITFFLLLILGLVFDYFNLLL